jgi:hypothetical protein
MSTHRFDHKVDRRFDTEASHGARVEVITGVERRRDWTDEAKLAIIAESCEAAASVGTSLKKNSKKRAHRTLLLLGSIGGHRGAPAQLGYGLMRTIEGTASLPAAGLI